MIRDNKERGDFYKALHALEHKEKISKDEIEELFRNFSIPKEEFIKAILQHFNEVARGSFPEDDKDWTAAYIIVNNVDKEGLRIDIILDKYWEKLDVTFPDFLSYFNKTMNEAEREYDLRWNNVNYLKIIILERYLTMQRKNIRNATKTNYFSVSRDNEDPRKIILKVGKESFTTYL